MEHPGLDVNKIKEELNLEEIQVKIKEISNRLRFAYQTNNQQLINQLAMVMETYTRAQMEKLNEMFGNDKEEASLTGKIDIS
jgi:hypothetical protein